MIWTKYRIFVFWWSRFGLGPTPPLGYCFFAVFFLGHERIIIFEKIFLDENVPMCSVNNIFTRHHILGLSVLGRAINE